jgi:hypothetical protein
MQWSVSLCHSFFQIQKNAKKKKKTDEIMKYSDDPFGLVD